MSRGQVGSAVAIFVGICGGLALLCGVAVTIAGIVWIGHTVHRYGVVKGDGIGIWSGLALIITGISGIIVAKKRRWVQLQVFLVLGIITCIVSAVQAFVSGDEYKKWRFLHHGGGCKTVCEASFYLTILVLSCISVFICFLASLATIVTLCCRPEPKRLEIIQPVMMDTPYSRLQ